MESGVESDPAYLQVAKCAECAQVYPCACSVRCEGCSVCLVMNRSWVRFPQAAPTNAQLRDQFSRSPSELECSNVESRSETAAPPTRTQSTRTSGDVAAGGDLNVEVSVEGLGDPVQYGSVGVLPPASNRAIADWVIPAS